MNREIILNIHSILGAIVFVTGLLNIILKKEGLRHRITGQVYLYCWLAILITGAYLGGLIITIIGIFGFYFALTGARIGHLKNKGIALFEKIIFSVGGIVSIVMLYYSLSLYLGGDQSFAIIFAVFGLIFLFTTSGDIFKYILHKPFKKQIYGKLDWMFEHFTRMSISFIAAVTAFTSIQNVFRNNTLNFLMPTVIGVVFIKLATRFYKKRFLN